MRDNEKNRERRLRRRAKKVGLYVRKNTNMGCYCIYRFEAGLQSLDDVDGWIEHKENEIESFTASEEANQLIRESGGVPPDPWEAEGPDDG